MTEQEVKNLFGEPAGNVAGENSISMKHLVVVGMVVLIGIIVYRAFFAIENNVQNEKEN